MTRSAQREEVDTIIFSDTHLGSPMFRAKTLRAALARFRPKRIVGNGDIFDGSDLGSRRFLASPSRSFDGGEQPHRLPRSHQDFLRDVNGLAKDGTEVWWVPGNHDDGLWRGFALIAGFLGARVSDECVWEYAGKRFLATHGDHFDEFYHKYRWTSEIATRIYEFVQHLGFVGRWLCAHLKARSKDYTHALDCVAQGATLHAAHKKVNHVFCGHTHHAEHQFLNGVHYYNSGCWTMDVCSLITIGEKGIRIHYFDQDGKEVGVEGWAV